MANLADRLKHLEQRRIMRGGPSLEIVIHWRNEAERCELQAAIDRHNDFEATAQFKSRIIYRLKEWNA